jgi:hypothetical protein
MWAAIYVAHSVYTGLFKKDGAKIKACGESGKHGNRSITEGNEGEMLQVRACVCMRR